MSQTTERVTTRRVDLEVTDLVPSNPQNQAMIEVAATRAAQEVQAAMVVAKKFPRDLNQAFNRIMQSCKRKSLAEQAIYSYPRGGSKVEGPSIRLAEVLAQNWGNMESGVIELERRPGESTAMAYCWDLETNTRDVKVFQIRHIRDKRGGGEKLTDERDIYELLANMGSRRKRACILAVIPGDIADAAQEECEKTMRSGNGEPIADRIRKMVAAFSEISVSIEMLEARLRHKLDACSETELVALRKIYQSLKDGMSNREDFFPVAVRREAADLGEILDQKKSEPAGASQEQGAPVRPVTEAEVSGYPNFHQAFEQQVAGDWTPDEMAACLGSLKVLTAVALENGKGAAARRTVLEALRAGKRGKDGKLVDK